MSYVTIYKVRPDGEVVNAFEVRNAMAGALYIWEQLREKYGVGTVMNYDPLWKMFPGDRMELADKIVMGMTFDRVIIKKENLPAVVKALSWFICNTAKSEGNMTLFGIQEALRKLHEDPDCTGVCFNQTSVSRSLWTFHSENDDEYRPYNINKDEGHWYLFDELPTEAAAFGGSPSTPSESPKEQENAD